ncbi:MAG: aldehyde dehydrogenase family protein, partial [bacterium]|nr:aldehyde dehydrogenase family protein [bacterium]
MSQGLRHFTHHIGGGLASVEEGAAILRHNPADRREAIGTVPIGTRATAQAAIAAAARAYPEWAATPAPTRARIIRKAGELARQRIEELALAMTLEAGKPLKESRGEINKGILVLDYYDGAGLRLRGEVTPAEANDVFTYTQRFPLGVVALITPWNFPWAVPLWKIAPALVAGNTIVWKPNPLTPWTSECIMELFRDAGLPDGVLNLVHGEGEAGEELVRNPTVQAVSFTGSTTVGRQIYRTAAERALSRVLCELGGKNAVVVMPDADLELAVTGIVGGAFVSVGQRCTATSRVLVHADVATRVTEMIVARAKALKVGPGLDPETQMGPVVSEEHCRRIIAAIEAATLGGIRCLTGGSRLTDGALVYGSFVAPTVFDEVPPNCKLFHDEVFGPVLGITTVASYPEAINFLNAVEY